MPPELPEARAVRGVRKETPPAPRDGDSDSWGDELAGLVPMFLLLLILVLAFVNAME